MNFYFCMFIYRDMLLTSMFQSNDAHNLILHLRFCLEKNISFNENVMHILILGTVKSSNIQSRALLVVLQPLYVFTTQKCNHPASATLLSHDALCYTW